MIQVGIPSQNHKISPLTGLTSWTRLRTIELAAQSQCPSAGLSTFCHESYVDGYLSDRSENQTLRYHRGCRQSERVEEPRCGRARVHIGRTRFYDSCAHLRCCKSRNGCGQDSLHTRGGIARRPTGDRGRLPTRPRAHLRRQRRRDLQWSKALDPQRADGPLQPGRRSDHSCSLLG